MRLLGALSVSAAVLACAPAAHAHIVVGSKSVRSLVNESDLVLRARIVGARGVAARSSEAPGLERPEVEAEVLAVLKGEIEAPRIGFVQHGHGVAGFEPGREHLLFLVDISRSRELDVLGAGGAQRWVSLQEHDEAYPLDEPGREALLAAARAYVDAAAAANFEARSDAVHAGTLGLLTSGDSRLAASALSDLVGAPNVPLVTPADRPALEALLDDPATPISVCVALLTELERRGLVDGQVRWTTWLADDAPTADLVVAIRAAGHDGRPEVRARMLALLSSERVEVASASAAALGRPGDASVVGPLARALGHPSSRVRHAAVRGLGRIGTPAAIHALEQAGESHSDPATRRLARAEARKRQAGAESP